MNDDEYCETVHKHSNRLYLIALSYTKSHYDAEDIVQNVFFKLWKKHIHFNDEEHLKKWLTAVCINECKDTVKMSFLRRNNLLDEETEKELYTFDTPKSFDIFNSLMKLPQKERTVIHLFYYEDMSLKEISKTLKISVAAVKTRLHRARNTMKEILGDDWINE